jgi:hypothetical protein
MGINWFRMEGNFTRYAGVGEQVGGNNASIFY